MSMANAISETIDNYLSAQYHAAELDHAYFHFKAGDGWHYVATDAGIVGGPFASETEAEVAARNERGERPID